MESAYLSGSLNFTQGVESPSHRIQRYGEGCLYEMRAYLPTLQPYWLLPEALVTGPATALISYLV